MIVFNLSCANDHRFEGWFASNANFESQRDARQLSCPVCGSEKVSKEIHAPYVNTGACAVPTAPARQAEGGAEPVVAFQQALAKLADHVIASTEDVGDAFPEEARKIHYREVPERAIRGNASPDEVAELRDEGIEVVSIPVPKHRFGNSH